MRISDWSSDVCSSDRAAANESRGLHYPRRGSAGTVLYGAGSASRCSDAETTSPQSHYLTALSTRATDRLTGRDRASDRISRIAGVLQHHASRRLLNGRVIMDKNDTPPPGWFVPALLGGMSGAVAL